jgi:hypothetical protein
MAGLRMRWNGVPMAAAGLGSERAGVQQTLALGTRFKGPCNCNKRLDGRMAVGADAIDAQGRQKVSAMVPSSSSKEEREEGLVSGFFWIKWSVRLYHDTVQYLPTFVKS